MLSLIGTNFPKGIRSIHFTVDAQKWLSLVTQRFGLPGNNFDVIGLPDNNFDVTYPLAPIMAYFIRGMWLCTGAQIMSKLKNFYQVNKKAPHLPSLISEMCIPVEFPKEC